MNSMLQKIITIVVVAVTFTLSPAKGPSFAQTTTTPPSGMDLACMQIAVERRDNAIVLAFNDKASAIQQVLTQRRDALKSAWGQANPRTRRQLRAVAWTAYREGLADILQDYRLASRTVWNQFKTAAKTCRAPSSESGVDASSSGNDQGL